ncbi:NPP1 family protein [Shewanella sp.]|uniref:NPP1 family protein n=1 Tax=Shewanella sp. TaxID=50422 RepID=UPI001EBF24B9|nr:NPP1 family protein [Shewanella sp.]NRB24146.1 NPP1 family protein [Shewanella sp.]
MNIKLCGLALLIISSPSIADDFPKLDEAYTGGTGSKDLRPVFDMDMDGCLPSAGISRDGIQNGGLNNSGAIDGDCRRDDFLNYSNTLHRYACIIPSDGIEYCNHFYALYFKKDQASLGFGHRHDWEYVSIWTKDGNETHGGYSAHGGHYLKEWSQVPKLNGRAKFVYHKDGLSTHAFRFAKDDEPVAENPTGNWITPDITSWYEMYGDDVANKVMRANLNSFDYGSANIPMKDSNYLGNINSTRPSGYPAFTQASIEASNPYSADEWENAIIHTETGLCLDVQSGVESGNRIITYTCKESSNQQFVYNSSNKTIKVKDTNLCLDVYQGVNADNQTIQVYTCNSGTNQQWTLDGKLIKSNLSGTARCMDRNASNGHINLWTCGSSNKNQQFEHDL